VSRAVTMDSSTLAALPLRRSTLPVRGSISCGGGGGARRGGRARDQGSGCGPLLSAGKQALPP
jgi:hypothetical protein